MKRFLSYGFAALIFQMIFISGLQAATAIPDGILNKGNFGNFWGPEHFVGRKTARFLIHKADPQKAPIHSPEIIVPLILEQKKSRPPLSEWNMKFKTARLVAASA